MEYAKPALTLEQQADRLLGRGLIASRADLIERLRVVGYYRLSAYWHPFRRDDPSQPGALLDEFREGTSLDVVWDRYVFDRQLRLIVLDAMERIEVALRAMLALEHATRHGQFGYALDRRAVPHLAWDRVGDLLSRIAIEQARSKEAFAKHFRSRYGDEHAFLPLWMAAEIMTFGTLLTLYTATSSEVRRAVASAFGVHDTVFESWFKSLNVVRNICAHHGRLWNRELGLSPKIPERLTEWKHPVRVKGDRVFGILTICKWSLDRVSSPSSWGERVVGLLRQHPRVPLVSMGFPEGWECSPIWR
ncbi:MAG: Abi family protein [Phycisphaerales bacterium]